MSGGNIFQPTLALDSALSDLVSLTKLLGSGLWALRTDVAGYLSQVPDASSDQLDHRFMSGSGLAFGNFPVVLEESWPNQRGRLAQLALMGAFGLFEGWVAEICNRYAGAVPVKRLSKALQEPPASSSLWPTPPDGVDVALQLMKDRPPRYRAAMDAFQVQARKRATYSGGRLEHLMVALRAFKELRNAIAHEGRVVDADVEMWCLAASKLTREEVGLRQRALDLTANKAGAPISIDVYDVVGLMAILRRVATTIDADAAVSKEAEAEVLRRFPGTVAHPLVARGPKGRLAQHISNILSMRARIPGPDAAAMPDVIRMLTAEGLLRLS